MEFIHLEEYLERNAAQSPEKTALVTETRALNWDELNKEAERAAAEIDAYLPQTDKQMVIAVLLPNSWEFVVVYLAILKLGHIAAPVDPTFKDLEIKAIVDRLDPALFIRGEQFVTISIETVTAVNSAEILNGRGSGYRKVRLPVAKQVASLIFTSGTTGKPKIVANTHHNHIWSIAACADRWGWTADEALLVSLPLSHWHGLVMGLGATLVYGSRLHLHERFDPEKTLLELSSGKITHFTHVSLVYERLLEHAPDRNFDLSGVNCFSATLALPPDLWEGFKDRFGAEITEAYGSSEAGRITSNVPGHNKPGSPGTPLSDVALRIEPDGEIAIKSPGLSPGYWGNPELTRANFTADGWWKTGDLGEIRDGYVYLKGRIQERIKKNGYMVYPRDVEWAVRKLEGVKDIYVAGQSSESRLNDSLVYFVVGTVSGDEIGRYGKEHLPAQWRPDRIIFLDELPRGRTGKPKVGEFQRLLSHGAERLG